MSQDPEKLAGQLDKSTRTGGLPPLEKWHPELSGDMDLRITRDGTWLFKGSPIAREEIVRLFSTILRREEDGEYYLVTPVEKWRIQVEDSPLLAHTMKVENAGTEAQVVTLTTNMGETLEVGNEHPIEVGLYPGSEDPRPVVMVRHGVEARLVTAAYYDLAEYIVECEIAGVPALGVMSHGILYKIGDAG
ncbi:DUF1285 domain-containing protein [Marinobacter salinexigens]|uniref:DUF1285 domain-containing protein n=1 Tax=Marinobacter salinexigens TaxID=2919747 RepID=A0A5B0VM32_9GAMM|nr:DUF1285 domain-containing protein [Marinobacter salinexigens]KAA1175185.1 DUF1285 domain-containing protein [Marinobacter salinexigens]